jgi:hypothetical protein
MGGALLARAAWRESPDAVERSRCFRSRTAATTTGGDLRLVVRTCRTGKAGSLKRTGTDIESVEIVRRPLPEEE